MTPRHAQNFWHWISAYASDTPKPYRTFEMRHYQIEKRNDVLKGIALIAVIFALFGLLPGILKKADCANALETIGFYEDCKADANCMLNARDTRAYKNNVRLKHLSCPKKD